MEADMNSGKTRQDRRRFLATGGTALGLALAAPTVLRAQTLTLKLSTWLPINGQVIPNSLVPWSEQINQRTEGRVAIEFIWPPLGPPPAHLDLLLEGKTDITFSIHGYSGPDAFPRAKIGQFSFLGDAYSASNAFSRVYGELLDAEEEHQNMKLLGLFQHGPGMMMLRNKEMRHIDDLRGLKIRNPGGYVSGLLQDLGIEPVAMPPTDARDALLAGTIDGIMFPYEGCDVFNVLDVVTQIIHAPGGFYNSSLFFGMNLQSAERLSPEDFETIQSFSRQTIHEYFAKAMDYADYVAIEKFKALGTPVLPLEGENLEIVRSKASSYETTWAEQVSGQGYDGLKALAYTRRITGTGQN
jgi:TRAP-type C4-dicarboxylate transport system substrate-binding protein